MLPNPLFILFHHLTMCGNTVQYKTFFAFNLILNTKTELLVTLWLYCEDDVSESPLLSLFLKVTILQVPSSAVKKEGLIKFVHGVMFKN